MPDFERLTDSLRIWTAPSESTREWARGYASGKSRARKEALVVAAVIYFAIAAYGAFFGA
jgi:hypothetical protein